MRCTWQVASRSGLGERGVEALGHHDVACLRRPSVDDSRSRAAGHGMLAEDRELEVTGLVGVTAVQHQPVVAAAGHPRQAADRLDAICCGSGVSELAGDEVVEHVKHEQRGRHSGTLLPHPALAESRFYPDTRPAYRPTSSPGTWWQLDRYSSAYCLARPLSMARPQAQALLVGRVAEAVAQHRQDGIVVRGARHVGVQPAAAIGFQLASARPRAGAQRAVGCPIGQATGPPRASR